MGDGLERMIAALDAAGSKRSRAGGGQVFQCPAHEDRSPSLSVGSGATMDVVFNCHAGCEKDAILEALGLTWKDIFGNDTSSQEYQDRRADLWMPCQKKGCGGHKSAEYRYTDEGGKLLYAVARCSRKGDGCPHPFAQWRPDPSKKYGKAWGLPGDVRHVLYNLPKVVAAAKAGKRIFLMEGEKDSDRMGLDYPEETSTSAVSGAGKSKWKPEYCRYFKGASEVIIVADCDKAGLEYAEEVHRHLSKVVPKVRVKCSSLMEDGADFSDHRDYGLTLDELEIVPFAPIKKRPEMVIEVEERDREKEVVFSGYSQESVERSLIGSMLRYGHSYTIAPIDIVTDKKLIVTVQAVARLAKNGRSIDPESVALEIEEMGISTYDKALPELLKIEQVAFSDAEKPKTAARILRERTMRTHIASWLNAAKRRVVNEAVDLGMILDEMRSAFARHAEEYVDLDVFCEPVGDAFAGDVLEEIILEETESKPKTNVRAIRPQVVIKAQVAAQGG